MKTNQRILILGLGGVGSYLAMRLANEGHFVTVIEANAETIRQVEGEIDARFLCGDAMTYSCWLDAGARRMDHLIAVTDDDALNILGALIGERFGIQHKIARVRNHGLWTESNELKPKDLAIDLVIQPEELAAQEVARLLKMQSGNIVIDLAGGEMQVMAVRIRSGSSMADRTIKGLAQDLGDFDFRVVAIARGINTLFPSGEDRIQAEDQVFILAHSADLPALMLMAELGPKRRQRVMVIGGGDIGGRIAELLQSSFSVKLIEKDADRAEQLSQNLSSVELLHGDGAETNTLLTAGLLSMDTVITATGDNDTNIMTSVLAKQLIRNQPGELHGKEAKTVALVKREQHLSLAAAMGADIVLNKKVLAGNAILEHLRRGEMLTVAHLHGVDADVVELVAGPRAPITRRPLSGVPAPGGNLVIGCVFQDGEWRTAVGSTQVEPGDRVIAVCRPESLPDLEHLVLG